MPVFNKFLEVRGTFEISTKARVLAPRTLLIHFRFHSIKHVAHFTIVQQLLEEYYHGNKELTVLDVPINVGDGQALVQWRSAAAKTMATLSEYQCVLAFITVHSDPDRGDLWVGQDEDNAAGAIAVDEVSIRLFFPMILIISILCNSGSIKYWGLSRPSYVDQACSYSLVARF